MHYLIAIMMLLASGSQVYADDTQDTAAKEQQETHHIVKSESYVTLHPTVNNAAIMITLSDVDTGIWFYPDNLEQSELKALVTLSNDTLDAPYEEVSDGLLERDWLDADTYETARFVARDFERQSNAMYKGYGRITLRDTTLPVEFYMILTKRDDGKIVADVMTKVNRLDYGIGLGEWEDTDTVANVVAINAHIVTDAVGDAGDSTPPLYDRSQ